MRLSETQKLKDLKTRDLPTTGSSTETTDESLKILGNAALSDYTPQVSKSIPFLPSGEGQANAGGVGATVPTLSVEQAAPELLPACGAHRCKNDHTWPIKIGLVQCEGCKRMMLGIAFANCPICNEPIATTRLRVDYSTERIGFAPRCAGASNEAETHFLTLRRDGGQLPEAE